MSFRHGKFAEVTVNSVALSTFCDSVDLNIAIDTSDTTTFTATWKTAVVGVPGATLTLSGDYDPTASTGPAVTFEALVGADPFAVVLYPGGPATSPAQRKRTFNAILTSYGEQSSVSDKVTFSANLLVTGAITFAAAT